MSTSDLGSSNFLGLPPERSSWTNSKAAIILAPLESTTSFQHGTAHGPEAILSASTQVETYDIRSGHDFSSIGIATLENPDFSGLTNERALERIEADVTRVVDAGLWPLTLGGEHTITLAPVRVLKKKYADLCVVQIDAHADLRDTYEGSPLSHACVMKRLVDMNVPVTGLGIRNYSAEEAQFIKQNPAQYKIFHDTDIHERGFELQKISSGLSKNVYLSIDIDGFDPSECPGTGTPEPNGLKWAQVLPFLKHLFAQHNVVGADINEVRPIAGDARTEFFAAKLAYQLLGFKFFN